MDWIKWRLPPSPPLPFIMQLFFVGGGKHGRLCSTPQFHVAPGVGTGARKCLAALRGIEKTFTLQAPSSFPITGLCLGGSFELVLASLPLKAVSQRPFWRHQTHVCRNAAPFESTRLSSGRCKAFFQCDIFLIHTWTYAQKYEYEMNCKRRRGGTDTLLKQWKVHPTEEACRNCSNSQVG